MKFAVAGLTFALCCAVTGANAMPVSSSSAPTPTALPVAKTVVVVKKVVKKPPPRRVVKKKVIIKR